ncbi:hypothetical protein LZ30DRAFT_685808 [Colletotrichum cereale]|nr:hypothetical protein LZ30DRAFT_685808 [Colletotrichum cereale]
MKGPEEDAWLAAEGSVMLHGRDLQTTFGGWPPRCSAALAKKRLVHSGGHVGRWGPVAVKDELGNSPMDWHGQEDCGGAREFDLLVLGGFNQEWDCRKTTKRPECCVRRRKLKMIGDQQVGGSYLGTWVARRSPSAVYDGTVAYLGQGQSPTNTTLTRTGALPCSACPPPPCLGGVPTRYLVLPVPARLIILGAPACPASVFPVFFPQGVSQQGRWTFLEEGTEEQHACLAAHQTFLPMISPAQVSSQQSSPRYLVVRPGTGQAAHHTAAERRLPPDPATNRLASICRTRPHLAGNIAVTGCFPPYHKPSMDDLPHPRLSGRGPGLPVDHFPSHLVRAIWPTSQSQCQRSSPPATPSVPHEFGLPARFRWFLSREPPLNQNARVCEPDPSSKAFPFDPWKTPSRSTVCRAHSVALVFFPRSQNASLAPHLIVRLWDATSAMDKNSCRFAGPCQSIRQPAHVFVSTDYIVAVTHRPSHPPPDRCCHTLSPMLLGHDDFEQENEPRQHQKIAGPGFALQPETVINCNEGSLIPRLPFLFYLQYGRFAKYKPTLQKPDIALIIALYQSESEPEEKYGLMLQLHGLNSGLIKIPKFAIRHVLAFDKSREGSLPALGIINQEASIRSPESQRGQL